jgi:hypothetical protein
MSPIINAQSAEPPKPLCVMASLWLQNVLALEIPK